VRAFDASGLAISGAIFKDPERFDQVDNCI
jgi:hypothetical protein